MHKIADQCQLLKDKVSEFCAALNPQYKVPVKATVKAHLESRYNENKVELISQLKEKDVAFTTDLWTSHGKQAYITVTYHYYISLYQ